VDTDSSNTSAPGQGFIQIHPEICFEPYCPEIGRALRASDWTIPGQWTLAKIDDPESGRSYWTDLPYGVGLIAPMFLDPASGEVSRPAGGRWYSDVTAHAWRNRSDTPIQIRRVVRRKARHACLVNCLNPHWGDAVSLLLRISQLRSSGLDVIILATENLAWLVPDEVAEIWLVQGGLGLATQWSINLALQIKEMVQETESCYVPCIFQPAQVSSQELRQFSRVQPFPCEEWHQRLAEKAVVTFAWRSDRSWSTNPEITGFFHTRLGRSRYLRPVRDWWIARQAASALRDQNERVAVLYQKLLRNVPHLDFGVIGHAGAGGVLPSGIVDMRSEKINAEIEKRWCERAASSHVLVGVHGSHMLLPSGHAGATIELLPRDRLGNILQDLLFTCEDHREAVFRCRLLPLDTPAELIAEVTQSILSNYQWAHASFHHELQGPLPLHSVEALRAKEVERCKGQASAR